MADGLGGSPRSPRVSTVEIEDIELPPFPDVAAAVLKVVNDPDSGVDAVAGLVQRDPALAATVMSVANSAAFRVGAPAVTLVQAIGRLGLRTVTELTVVACLKPAPRNPEARIAMSEVWRESVATAGYARFVSKLRRRQVESAFLCGLLHNIGALVMLDHGEHSLERIHARYVEVGMRVAMGWKMPASVVAAVALHRDWAGADTYAEEAATTWLSRLLAQEALEMNVESDEIDHDAVLERLDIYPNDLERLRDHRGDVMSLVEILA